MKNSLTRYGCLTALALVVGSPAIAQSILVIDPPAAGAETTVLNTITVQAAAEQLRQALGVSTITAEDLARTPVGRDLAELIRTQPGVNLSGNTSTGQRGNQRQIDLRGMGPENTMILIDGIPVNARNAVRMGRQGERDTRGDSNWVSPELIESVEVLRGPAAARYGSGAAGGVVNIITRRPDRAFGTFSSYFSAPEHADEGATRRAGLVIGAPINDIWSHRLALSGSWTDADSPDINDAAVTGTAPVPAGREGVENLSFSSLWSAQVDAANRLDLQFGYSRQGNRYAGDRQLSQTNDTATALAAQAAETNVMQRSTATLSHHGDYGFAESRSHIQWEHTDNRRLQEGTGGAVEGLINAADTFHTITLDNINAKTEWDIPLEVWRAQMLTLGAEFRGEYMNDPTVALQANVPGGDVPIAAPDDRDPDVSAWTFALYAENNILVTDRLTLTPGLRLDQHSNFGLNLSPSLNATLALNDNWTLNGGIARAFKAPNLFQLNPNYLWSSAGNGCNNMQGPGAGRADPRPGCIVIGNPDLDPEQSINIELGIAYEGSDGHQVTLTYFHNDYDQRVQASTTPVMEGYLENGRTALFQWVNAGPAVLSGLEGSLTLPLTESLTLTANATRMLESEVKQTGAPLSLVPDYTLNAALRWQAGEDLGLTLSTTSYGEIKPRRVDFYGNPLEAAQAAREAYSLINIAADFAVTPDVAITAGITNLADRRLLRSGNGAETYNEAGRSLYVGVTASF